MSVSRFDKHAIVERLKEGAVLGIPIVILQSIGWIPDIRSILGFSLISWLMYAVQSLILGYVAAIVVYKVN